MELDKMLAAGISEAVEEIMSWYKDVLKVPIVAKLKLVVMPKKKGVSKLKMRPLEKIIFGGASVEGQEYRQRTHFDS